MQVALAEVTKKPLSKEAMIEDREKRLERLSRLGLAVAGKRDKAVKHRRESGIEKIWTEDTEYYEGIDDANRQTHTYTKAWSPDGGIYANASNSGQTDAKGECTAFFNITRQFVDSASARMGDILLPAGDWNWKITPTPIADLETIKDSAQPVVDENGSPVQKEDGSGYSLGEFAAQEQRDADAKVEKAELRIRDHLTECHIDTEERKVIEDAAKIGTGILRGPVPRKQRSKVVIDGKFIIKEAIVPSSQRVDPFDFFPDPDCGDNIHDGSFCIERDRMSATQLRDLADTPGYIGSQVRKVLNEGPGKLNIVTEKETESDSRYEVWYFYGEISADEFTSCDCKLPDDSQRHINVVLVLVNDSIIKAYANPNTTGDFPYDVLPWQPRNDSPFGIGVSRQGRVAQDMINASARSLMRNTGLSSAPQIVFSQGKIIPMDGDYNMYGGKFWIAVEDEGVTNVRDAIQTIDIPSKQAELINLIQLAQKMMEDSTGVSFLLQGQQGSAPDTVGGMELLHKNASALLRRIARVFDERVTEPHIRRYYEWLLIHGKDDEKGDMQIKAIGSSALVEREIQAMQAVQILNMSLNPAFGFSPQKAAEEVLRAWRFEPSKFEMSDDEKKAAQNVQPQPMPQVEVAKINAKSREDIAQAQIRSSEHKIIEDMDRDTVYQETLKERTQQEFQARREELVLRRELALMDYANKHQISLEKVKAELAKTTMRLRTQKELASQDGKSPQVAVPAVEPVGRAPTGEAFQK